MIPALESASQKEIPVVAFDRSAFGAPYLFFVGSDDVEAGRLACRFLADRLSGSGRIIVLEGAVGSSPAINRSKGFYEEIALEMLVNYLRTGTPPKLRKHLVKPWIITRKNLSAGDFYSIIQN